MAVFPTEILERETLFTLMLGITNAAMEPVPSLVIKFPLQAQTGLSLV